MAITSRGFSGRRTPSDVTLPPGQYPTTDFPVLSAGPTPRVPLDQWEFTINEGTDVLRRWDWKAFRKLPAETITVDIHTDASHTLVHSYGGYTTNLPLEDLMDKQAWIAFRFDDDDLAPEHGGPARLLVPHLYLWKSAKWVMGITLMDEDQPGFWESLGYHNYGDPWREQRYQGD